MHLFGDSIHSTSTLVHSIHRTEGIVCEWLIHFSQLFRSSSDGCLILALNKHYSIASLLHHSDTVPCRMRTLRKTIILKSFDLLARWLWFSDADQFRWQEKCSRFLHKTLCKRFHCSPSITSFDSIDCSHCLRFYNLVKLHRVLLLKFEHRKCKTLRNLSVFHPNNAAHKIALWLN